MDESRYLKLAEDAFEAIEKALEPIDPDVVDYERTQDVLEISFPGKLPCVINTQRPTRQIWLAFERRAWHFDYEPETGKWIDDKGSGVDLFGCVRDILERSAGVKVEL